MYWLLGLLQISKLLRVRVILGLLVVRAGVVENIRSSELLGHYNATVTLVAL